ncbi:MAG: succinate dehydrogenase hydrophobic membrane anchor subunit [Bacteroidia bacterium]|nr:succinate dehydrogenase hydrophobic membrane anchor subunit [Bacteroidia bacterium]MDW8348106.1 succinate dehydrogenase hydrophobic membrane anchor subunit [Bacteroidia bacterium]
MKNYQYGQSSKSNAFNWFFHRISGTLLIFFLVTHFWIQHYNTSTQSVGHKSISSAEIEKVSQNMKENTLGYPDEHKITPYDRVMHRLKSPDYAILWKAFNILFLVFALHHGFYGMTNIISDYVRNGTARAIAITACWLLAAGLFVIGTYSTIVAGLDLGEKATAWLP